VRSRVCAVPLAQVVETMRPLPVEPITGVPPFVRGLSIIRGSPVPVVDLGSLLADSAGEASTRFVTLRVGDRRVALAVEAVLGVRELDVSMVRELPPLLRDARAHAIQAIGSLDAELLVVLSASHVLPADVWQGLAAGGLAA
jgi:purine-binding chemotaxis protein CheW